MLPALSISISGLGLVALGVRRHGGRELQPLRGADASEALRRALVVIVSEPE